MWTVHTLFWITGLVLDIYVLCSCLITTTSLQHFHPLFGDILWCCTLTWALYLSNKQRLRKPAQASATLRYTKKGAGCVFIICFAFLYVCIGTRLVCSAPCMDVFGSCHITNTAGSWPPARTIHDSHCCRYDACRSGCRAVEVPVYTPKRWTHEVVWWWTHPC